MQSFARYDCALLQNPRPEHFMGRTWAPHSDHVLSAGVIVAVSALVSYSLHETRQLIKRISQWLKVHDDKHEDAPTSMGLAAWRRCMRLMSACSSSKDFLEVAALLMPGIFDF